MRSLASCAFAIACASFVFAGDGVIELEVRSDPDPGGGQRNVPDARVRPYATVIEPAGPKRKEVPPKRTIPLQLGEQIVGGGLDINPGPDGVYSIKLTSGRVHYLFAYPSKDTREFLPGFSARTAVRDGENYSRALPILLKCTSHPNTTQTLQGTHDELQRLHDQLPDDNKNDRDLRARLLAWMKDLDAVQKARRRLLIPAYFNPNDNGADWNKIALAAADPRFKTKLHLVTICNPDNGPGKQVDPNYPPKLAACVNSGVQLVGYVPLNYGRRKKDDVDKDIALWVQMYPSIDGFFFDELPDTTNPQDVKNISANVQKARDELAKLRKNRKAAGGQLPAFPSVVIGNPGKAVDVEDWVGKGTLPARHGPRERRRCRSDPVERRPEFPPSRSRCRHLFPISRSVRHPQGAVDSMVQS